MVWLGRCLEAQGGLRGLDWEGRWQTRHKPCSILGGIEYLGDITDEVTFALVALPPLSVTLLLCFRSQSL